MTKPRVFIFLVLIIIFAVLLWFWSELLKTREQVRLSAGAIRGAYENKASPATASIRVEKEKVIQERSPEIPLEEKESAPKKTPRETFEEALDEPLVRACDFLHPSARISILVNQNLKKGKNSTDRLAMIGRVLMNSLTFRVLLRFPKTGKLLLDAEDSQNSVNTAQFAWDLYQSRKELIENLPYVKEIETRNYYAWMLMRAIGKDLRSYGDPQSLDLCKSFSNIDEPFSQERANEDLLRYLDKIGVSPQEIEFNPNFRSEIVIRHNKFFSLYESKTKDLSERMIDFFRRIKETNP